MLETVVSVEADAEQRAVGRYRRRPDSRHKDTLVFKILRQRDGGLRRFDVHRNDRSVNRFCVDCLAFLTDCSVHSV